MVQEDLNNKTISLSFKALRLTHDSFKKAIEAYLQCLKNHKTEQHGKISVKDLMKQDQGATMIPVSGDGLKEFEKTAKRYNVDFAVMRDKRAETGNGLKQYTVFFKAKDSEVINKAFQDFVKEKEKGKERPSVREKLAKMKKLAQSMDQDKLKEKKQEVSR